MLYKNIVNGYLREECVRVFITTHWCSTFFLAHTFKYSEKNHVNLGEYAVTSVIHSGAWLFANDDRVDMTTVQGDGAVSVVTDITDGNLTFGVELKSYQSNDCKFDHFTLEYLGSESTNSIGNVEHGKKTEGRYYDLTGRRINRPSKGLYIISGQGVVVEK